MRRQKRRKEENMTIRDQEKNSGLPRESNRPIPLNEEDSAATQYFEFNEGVYLEAVVDTKEWI